MRAKRRWAAFAVTVGLLAGSLGGGIALGASGGGDAMKKSGGTRCSRRPRRATR